MAIDVLPKLNLLYYFVVMFGNLNAIISQNYIDLNTIMRK